MTFEERLDAIAQSLKLLTSLHVDHERKMAEQSAKYEERFAKNEERFARTDERMVQLIDTMNRLGNIVISH